MSSSSIPLNTIAVSDVGDRLTVTASVVAVLAVRASVIGDVDLPDRGLLVLGGPSGGLRSRSLVTVTGRIDLFEFGRFADMYELEHPDNYSRFDGHRIVVADNVRSWA